MEGRLLHLLGDERADAGRSFWSCFEPLRQVFDRHHWVVASQPWFGWPPGFQDADGNSDTCVDDPHIRSMLWRPGSISRWAAYFSEEYVSLWAPAGADPVATVRAYDGVSIGRSDDFVQDHAAIRLEYSDSWCWEIFALDRDLLEAAESHVAARPDIKCYRTVSQNRRWGFSQIGWHTWPR